MRRFDFELPYPTTLTDAEVDEVRRGLVASAEAYKASVRSAASNYMAALAASLVVFIDERIDARKRAT